MVQLSKKFDFYSSKYENFVLGDFNAEMSNTHMEEFCSMYNFESPIKDPTCFKNPEKPTTIGHILTNHLKCFQHSGVYETGLSDFHRLTLTVLKVFHSKQNPKIIQYRDYKNFTNEHFRTDLLRELSFQNVQPNEFDKFIFIASKLLNSHAPLKKKYITCNQAVFINKQLRIAIMTRTRLLNKLRKFNCPENQLTYKRQRNYCVKLLKRSKKDFYNNLNVKKVTDNKHFWKIIKPNFTDKVLKDEKIVLVEGDKVITADTDLAEIFKDHFENVVESLHIERPCKVDFDREPVANAITNFSQHPSILKIRKIQILLLVSRFAQ